MKRSLVWIGASAAVLIVAALAVNVVALREEPVPDFSHGDRAEKNLFKPTADDPSGDIDIRWKAGGKLVDQKNPPITIYPRSMRQVESDKNIKYLFTPILTNLTKSTFETVTVVPLVVQVKTNKIIFEAEPFVLKSFQNEKWFTKGPLGPNNKGDCNQFVVDVPTDTWRSDTYVVLALKAVHRLPVSDKIQYPWELYQAMLEDPAYALRSIKADPSLLKLKTKESVTPLLMACASGDLQLIDYISKNGGEWADEAEKGLDALVFATSSDNLQMLDAVGKHVSAKKKYPKGATTPLHAAANQSLENSIYWLVSMGADMEARDELGHTPLFVSAHERSAGSMYLLISAGANINVKDKSSNNLYTICEGDWSCMQILFLAGLKFDEENPETYRTPIMEATVAQEIGSVYWYLKHGVKLEEKNSKGQDCWHFAKYSNTLQTDRFFREAISDPSWGPQYEEWKKEFDAFMVSVRKWAKKTGK